MSSGPAGKFQDHYIVLNVDPHADSETIQNAYSNLAKKYHPQTPETGNKEKFDQINQAFEVLSDPALRASFDKIKGVDTEVGGPKFSGTEFFDALGQGAWLRAAVLCLLYDRMRVKSFKPSLSMRNLENMLRVKGEDLNFALFYLKKRGLVVNDDKSALAITVDGMDYLEANRPDEAEVMKIIRVEAIASPPAPSLEKPAPKPAIEKPAAAETSVPVLSALNRALQRR
jgi:curved DNA-binding protein CbpA